MAAAVVAAAKAKKDKRDDDDEEANFKTAVEDNAKLASVPKHLRKAFFEAIQLPILDKFNAEAFADITLIETSDWVDALSRANRKDVPDGQICLDLVYRFLMTQLNDAPSAEETELLLQRFLGSAETGALRVADDGRSLEEINVTADELFTCFTVDDSATEFVNTRRQKRGLGKEITRTAMADRIEQVTDRNDALMTLPITVLYVILFVLLVIGHLRINERQRVETSIEEYVNGRDPLETADANVDDMDSWWDWVAGAGTEGPLGKLKVSLRTGNPYLLLASRNMLIGDVMLRRIDFDGKVQQQWLLNSATGAAALKKNPNSETRFRDAARQAAEHLKTTGWDSAQINTFQLKFNTYNEYARMFGLVEVTIPLHSSGAVTHVINCDAVALEPYPGIIMLGTLDALFALIVLWIFVHEFKDACHAIRLGCGEFKDYLQLWNCVDWVNILMSFASASLWGCLILSMNAKSLTSLVDDQYRVNVDLTSLTEDELNNINDDLEMLRNIYTAMGWAMAFNTASVVAKFFKAFGSNPRLMVVTKTFSVAGVDLVHFFIIFSTMFFPFCLVGHILFGSDILEFATISSSVNAGFLLIMGEFGWYVEEFPTYFTQTFPSGMPRIILSVWYMFFNFFVLLVLLNMLLAIVIDNYTSVSTDTKNSIECPTLFQQIKEFRAFKKKTKSFIPLEELRRRLENDEEPAHPGEEVSKSSLMDAFQDMKEDQAEWMMDWLHNFLDLKKEAQGKSKAELIEELAEKNHDDLVRVGEAELVNQARIDKLLESAKSQKASNEGRADGCSAKLDMLHKSVEGLTKDISKVRRDQDRTVRKVQELTPLIPKGRPASGLKRVVSDDAPKPPVVNVVPSKDSAGDDKRQASSPSRDRSPRPAPSAPERSDDRSPDRSRRDKDRSPRPAADRSDRRDKDRSPQPAAERNPDRSRSKPR